MDYQKYAKALVGSNWPVINLIDLVFTAHLIPSLSAWAFELIHMFDRLQIYDDDIKYLVNTVCEKNYCNVATLLWTAKVGLDYGLSDRCCNIEMIKEQIEKARENKVTDYPFDEARKLLRNGHFASIPESISDSMYFKS